MGTAEDNKRQAASNLLDDLAEELDKGFLEDTFTIAGHTWKMRLLQDHERNWANGFVRNASLNAMLTSIRAPTLGIGIREIDGMPVAQFFQKQWADAESELEDVARHMLESSNPYVKQYWFAEQLFTWISQRPPQFVEKLWVKWQELEARRTEAEEAMGKSSRPDGS